MTDNPRTCPECGLDAIPSTTRTLYGLSAPDRKLTTEPLEVVDVEPVYADVWRWPCGHEWTVPCGTAYESLRWMPR
jgi:hypothetical protein